MKHIVDRGLEFTKETSLQHRDTTYILRITDLVLEDVKLYFQDHQLIRECEKSKKISDKLLMLEMIVRRVEDQRQKHKKEVQNEKV